MNWESNNIGHQHIILKVKVPLIKAYCFDIDKDWDKGIHLFVLQLGNLYRSLSILAHLN